ncbi:hypothetical protein ACJIZ3_013996 [Penstemon smallii]|uniref:Uncharacterized protein n=1 Tax=Penstemon smallii TaxID=265156 RepID=A0ABD3RIM4_9LAMI
MTPTLFNSAIKENLEQFSNHAPRTLNLLLRLLFNRQTRQNFNTQYLQFRLLYASRMYLLTSSILVVIFSLFEFETELRLNVLKVFLLRALLWVRVVCSREDIDSMAPGIPAIRNEFCCLPASSDKISAAEVSLEKGGFVENFRKILAPMSCSSGEFESRSSMEKETMSILRPSNMLPFTHLEYAS